MIALETRHDSPRQWAIRLTIGVAGGLFFGLIGPFGSYERPLPIRLACWTAAFCLGVTLFVMAVRAAAVVAVRSGLPRWFAVGAAVALAAAPFSVAIGLLFNAPYWLRGSAQMLEFYGDCLLLTAPLTAIYLVLLPRLQAPRAPSLLSAEIGDPAPRVSGASLLSRLPPRLGRELIALQMEDHYVRAHTALGSDLLLTPIGQAIEDLPGIDGLRVHRSWWVARAAVRGCAWEGRNLRLKLTGGLEAPVARNQVATLRAAGWLGENEELPG